MNVPSISGECRSHGVIVFLSNGGVAARGKREALDKFKPILKRHKDEVTRYLAEHSANDMVREFMEIDGLTLAEAQALTAVSIQPRPKDEWLALIAELDSLIERYCAAAGLTSEERTAILSARCRQSLVSLDESLAWFRHELARLADKTLALTPAHERNFEGRTSAKAARAKMQALIAKV